MKDNISIAKGIAILLMVVGHSGIKWDIPILFKVINLFHMPLFIFAAGYCFKWTYVNNFKSFLWKRILGLWWPYVKYGVIFLLLHNVFFHLNIYNDSYGAVGSADVSVLYGPVDFLKKTFRLVVMSNTEQLLGGFWFLKTLFWGSIFALLSLKFFCHFEFFTLNKRLSAVVSASFFLILSVIFSGLSLQIPVVEIGLKEFLAAFFFLFGLFFGQKEFAGKTFYTVVFLIAVLGGGILFEDVVSMLNCKTWQIIPYCFFAIMGIIAVFNISNMLESKASKIKFFLVFAGCNTLIILTWHFLCFKLVSLVRIVCENKSMLELASFPVIPGAKMWSVAYVFVGVAIPLMIAKLKQNCKIKEMM